MDLVLNNLQYFISHETQTNKQTKIIYIYIYDEKLRVIVCIVCTGIYTKIEYIHSYGCIISYFFTGNY